MGGPVHELPWTLSGACHWALHLAGHTIIQPELERGADCSDRTATRWGAAFRVSMLPELLQLSWNTRHAQHREVR